MSKVLTLLLSFVGDELDYLDETTSTIIPMRIYALNALSSANPEDRVEMLDTILPLSSSRVINHLTLFQQISNTAKNPPNSSNITLQGVRVTDGCIFLDYVVPSHLYNWMLSNYTDWSKYVVGPRQWAIHGYQFYVIL